MTNLGTPITQGRFSQAFIFNHRAGFIAVIKDVCHIQLLRTVFPIISQKWIKTFLRHKLGFIRKMENLSVCSKCQVKLVSIPGEAQVFAGCVPVLCPPVVGADGSPGPKGEHLQHCPPPTQPDFEIQDKKNLSEL